MSETLIRKLIEAPFPILTTKFNVTSYAQWNYSKRVEHNEKLHNINKAIMHFRNRKKKFTDLQITYGVYRR